MKKIAVICTALLLAGCIEKAPLNDIQPIKRYQVSTYGELKEVCIDGVVYLLLIKGGITPKINANYDVYICNQSTNP
ncbi:hypothetical protein E5361_04615 [Histophilus somni]|uniref:hypothetical protein n=1 Tax=Histophilus somni TaxID=731 RepID=UPI0005A10A28|nr:hypothetical protein [Histophilus somni]THA21706.1 hypothetical protein E5361_04615 [Histophilus somni]